MFEYTELKVTYEDGTQDQLRTDQRDAAEFEKWALRRGIVAPPGRSLERLMPNEFFRVCAWSAYQRGQGKPVEYDDWSARVVEALPVDLPKPVDPTKGEPSA